MNKEPDGGLLVCYVGNSGNTTGQFCNPFVVDRLLTGVSSFFCLSLL